MPRSEAHVVTSSNNKTRSTFGQWCQATTYHGVRDFYCAQSNIGKLFWFIVVSMGLFFTANQIIELLLDFVSEDKWLTSMYPEIPPDGAMKWPHLRICNLNLFAASKLKKARLIDPYDIAYLQKSKNGILFHDKSQANLSQYDNSADLEDKIDEISRRLSWTRKAKKVKKKFLRSLLFNCNNMMIYCDDYSGFIHDREFCNCSKFQIPAPDDSTSCFHLNVSALASQSANIKGRSGLESGLQFLINPGTYDYYSNLIYGDIGDGGISIQLHFGDFDSDAAKFSNPVFLTPGSHSVVAMSLQKHRTYLRGRRGVTFFQSKLPCTTKPEYKRLRSTIPLRALCALDCAVHLYVLQCECVPRILVSGMDTDARKCDEFEISICSNKTEEEDWHQGPWPDGFNYSQCVDECKDPCEYDTISTKVSASQFPASSKVGAVTRYLNLESARGGVNKTYNDDVVRQLILMDLYYESNEYRVVERVNRVSIDEVISNIGGALGAWIGISFITVFQAFVYFGYGLVVFIRHINDRVAGRPVVALR